MTYREFEKRYALSPSREAIGRSLGRNAKRAFAKHSLQSPAWRKHLFVRIRKMIQAEMQLILRDCTCTVKCKPRIHCIPFLHGIAMHYTALKRVAPVLTGILDACIPRNSSKRQTIIVTCIAILVKSHCKTVIHLLLWLILYSGHAGKLISATP